MVTDMLIDTVEVWSQRSRPYLTLMIWPSVSLCRWALTTQAPCSRYVITRLQTHTTPHTHTQAQTDAYFFPVFMMQRTLPPRLPPPCMYGSIHTHDMYSTLICAHS